ncbi:MAG: hypothetical protein PF542_06260 [Nanoarchaeota archaeon]|jgi:outer membrane protein OmpA-like peptidoglycan-associated protein|nr:hypothetical protein [Nanoarchaeota archaeon]
MKGNLKNLTLTLGMILGLAGAASAQNYRYIKEVNGSHLTSVETKYEKPSFNFGEPQKGELKNSMNGGDLNVFHQTSKNNLYKNDSTDIGNYLESFEKASSTFVVKGIADIRGDLEKNYALSLRRANSVKGLISSRFPSSNIETVVVGESGGDGNLAENRISQIVPSNSSIKNGLESHMSSY